MNSKTEKRLQKPASGIPGGSTLMMVFAVLCLTVFAILALSTVLADARLSDRYADGVSAYYEADCEAQRIISEIRAGRVPGLVEEDGEGYSFSLPITETKALFVSLEADENSYEITDYHTEYTGTWEGENYFSELWTGN